ncbi:MAG: PspA/IM30 family protein [Bacteroidota bacterium]|nr:PspA/IM30 family protein [Bacteroidota bacterium]MXW15430.1 PspA/IM30 family protein [Rhodothermaceae bacterium]MDE2645875.1 PspA/IM30 family protein [Bacteroidota bacterium]MXW31971.1 PspA/IM30 family protein [Rhodothermaceae bacterium]MXZ16669.1 PspA/IM30 family protein [Rhodothermaceae bacterium]
MSLWTRFKRAIRSIFGGAISSLENPKLILEQNIRELNDQVPKMNENIATVKANVILLQKELKRVQSEVHTLRSKIQSAIQGGRDDLAQQHAVRFETAQANLVKTQEQLAHATAAYDKAQQVKKAFMRERQRKIDAAQEALRASERAKWQANVADALEKFEVGGIDQTHDEMIQRLDQETAKNEARIEVAMDSVDLQAIRLDEEAEDLRAAELVNQMKREMGLLSEPTTDPERIDVEIPEEKTMGRTRNRES